MSTEHKGDNHALTSAAFFAVLATVIELCSIIFNLEFGLFWQKVIFVLVTLYIGRDLLEKAYKALKVFNFKSIALLMGFAVIGAFYLGEFAEALLVVSLYNLGEELETWGFRKSHLHIDNLKVKTPQFVETEEGQKLAVDQVVVGTRLRIRPGDYLSHDGVVSSGEGSFDESALSGEALPKAKKIADVVLAGSLLFNGSFIIEVTKPKGQSLLDKMIMLTESALKEKAHFHLFIERFSKIYTPLVMGASLLVVVLGSLLSSDGFHFWLKQGLTLLVISCPCALVISTPLSLFASIGAAAKNGILIKSARAFEVLSKVSMVTFDKTKTLTFGSFEVIKLVPVKGVSENELLACAAGIENFSKHPMALAIREEALKQKILPHEAKSFQNIGGEGGKGLCLSCNASVFVGREKSLNQAPHELSQTVEAAKVQGNACVFVEQDSKLKGLIVLADSLRPEARKVVKDLEKMHVSSFILSGDHKKSVEKIAKEADIHSFEADLLPQDKFNFIDKNEKAGTRILMVGDGINDSPALARASSGMAFGTEASDLALEVAPMSAIRADLNLIPFSIDLSRRTVSVMKQNTFIALSTKAVVFFLALSGKASFALAIFSDVGVSLLVILLSLRLLRRS